jgi:hypothetical protein
LQREVCRGLRAKVIARNAVKLLRNAAKITIQVQRTDSDCVSAHSVGAIYFSGFGGFCIQQHSSYFMWRIFQLRFFVFYISENLESIAGCGLPMPGTGISMLYPELSSVLPHSILWNRKSGKAMDEYLQLRILNACEAERWVWFLFHIRFIAAK